MIANIKFLTKHMTVFILMPSCFHFDRINFQSFTLASMNWMKISHYYRNQ